MRFAIVSDIHANLPAWRAVLTDIAAQHVNHIVCLGDCVGYGPNPAEVLESLYRHVTSFCLGNHDAAVCGMIDTKLFQPHARRMIDWTRQRLSDKASRFLSNLPLELLGTDFRCVHGDFTIPAAFNYIENGQDAARSWPVTSEPLLFVGHTHVPAMFLIGDSGATHTLEPQDFVLEPGRRYLLNPGSVGSPRSGDALASYCIYDTTANAVYWRSVPFDLDACREAALAAGLGEDDTPFLARDPRQRLTSVREAVSFSPAQTPADQARHAVAASEITRLNRAARRWKRFAVIAILAGLLGLAATAALLILHPAPPASQALTIPAAELMPVEPASAANLLPPFPASTDGASLAGWRVRLDRPVDMLITPAHSGMALTVHGQPARFRIESPPIRVNRDTTRKVRLNAAWDWSRATTISVVYLIEELGAPDASGYPVVRRDTKDPPRTRNFLEHTSRAERLHSKTHYIRLAIEGECSGIATFSAPTLLPIK